MEHEQSLDLLPHQETGSEIHADKTIELASADEARRFFIIVKDRLLNVNKWQELTGKLAARFQLTNAEGEALDRPAQKGDLMKIDIPGPGSSAGDGYDWVIIEALRQSAAEDTEAVGFRVRPVRNPFSKRSGPAHFFSDNSTSTFVASRNKNKISASIHDRNAKPNTDTEAVTDKARNIAVAAGAIGGMSKLQWQSLVDGVLHKED